MLGLRNNTFPLSKAEAEQLVARQPSGKPVLVPVMPASVTFERSQTGSWLVMIDGTCYGKVWRDSKGWRAVIRDGDEWLKLPGYYRTRNEAASEVKIETATERRR